MEDIIVNGLTLKNIRIAEVCSYSGFDIQFTLQGKLFNFMIAKTDPLMPLNVLHRFKEQGICPICKKTIYPFPIGNQPCLELKKIDKLFLEKINEFLPVK